MAEQEIELRFHVPAEQAERLRRWLRQGRAPQELALQARYFDTTERHLARAGIGLRLRREGDQWVQTVKGPAADGISRGEHNAVLAQAAEQPDIGLHAAHPLGARLQQLLQGQQLQTTFATDILRQRKPRRLAGASVELACDQGRLLGGGAELAVHELELELLSGPPGALLAFAHQLLAKLPLSLDLRSKAERGEHLARSRRESPPRKARAPRLRRRQAPAAALRVMLLQVFEQMGANASQIGAGSSQPEHLHQLRVALRRLRALLALFKTQWPALDALELDRKARDWGRVLGVQRDLDVQQQGLQPRLALAWQALTGAALPAPVPHDGGTAAAALVRETGAQQFLLECLGAALALEQLPPPGEAALKPLLKRKLRRWWRQASREAAGFAALDLEGRHQLRKRCKRLRYALELCASLFDDKALSRALLLLRDAQELLGELNDVEAAMALRQAQPEADARQAFELGWLSAQREVLLAQAGHEQGPVARLAALGSPV